MYEIVEFTGRLNEKEEDEAIGELCAQESRDWSWTDHPALPRGRDFTS